MDADGYPTEDELKRIEEWDWRDPIGLMEYVYSLWKYADWGWKREGNCYDISTGGWSGNDTRIGAGSEAESEAEITTLFLPAGGAAMRTSWQP